MVSLARLSLLAALGATLLGARPAAADPAMACTGALKMNLGLVLRDRLTGAVNTIAAAAASQVVDQAECFCRPVPPLGVPAADTQDLAIEIRVTAGLPPQTQETFEVWVGNNCNDSVNRNGTTNSCEKIASNLTLTDFWNNAPGGLLYQTVPARALISPVIHSCDAMTPTNSVFFIFYTMSTMPDNICSIALASSTVLPSPPVSVNAGSGDGAVTLSWATSQSGNVPRKYQVLCATTDGRTVKEGQIANMAYSTCTGMFGIERRTLPSSGMSGSGDGGVIGDGGAGSGPSSGDDHPESDTPDGGTSGIVPTPGVDPFTNLDHRFVCSEPVEGTTQSTRIDGLTNGVTYKFLVVAVDDFGNPAAGGASAVVLGTPQPVEDLYRRFRDQGGKPQGFCFIATAAYGSYEAPGVQVLRRFRDQVLLPTATGRAFVDWYYRASPPWAAYIATHPAARDEVRGLLLPVIGLAQVHLWLGGWCEALGVGLLLALLLGRRRLRALLPSRSAA